MHHISVKATYIHVLFTCICQSLSHAVWKWFYLKNKWLNKMGLSVTDEARVGRGRVGLGPS